MARGGRQDARASPSYPFDPNTPALFSVFRIMFSGFRLLPFCDVEFDWNEASNWPSDGVALVLALELVLEPESLSELDELSDAP